MRYEINTNEIHQTIIDAAEKLFTPNTWGKIMKDVDGRTIIQKSNIIQNKVKTPTPKLPLKREVRDTDEYERYHTLASDFSNMIKCFGLLIHEYFQYDETIITISDKPLKTDTDSHTTMRILASKQVDVFDELYDLKSLIAKATKHERFDEVQVLQAVASIDSYDLKLRLLCALKDNNVSNIYEYIRQYETLLRYGKSGKYIKLSLINK